MLGHASVQWLFSLTIVHNLHILYCTGQHKPPYFVYAWVFVPTRVSPPVHLELKKPLETEVKDFWKIKGGPVDFSEMTENIRRLATLYFKEQVIALYNVVKMLPKVTHSSGQKPNKMFHTISTKNILFNVIN